VELTLVMVVCPLLLSTLQYQFVDLVLSDGSSRQHYAPLEHLETGGAAPLAHEALQSSLHKGPPPRSSRSAGVFSSFSAASSAHPSYPSYPSYPSSYGSHRPV